MIKERMLIFLCMCKIMEMIRYEGVTDEFVYKGKTYNGSKFKNDLYKLIDEFLEPYIIDKDLKK